MTAAGTDTDIDADALRLVASLLRLGRVVDARVRASGPADSLAIADLSVLGQIDRGNDLPSTIARELRLDPGRITRITDTLASLGYLDRREDPDDRRRCRLALTPAGAERLRRGRVDITTLVQSLLADLSPQERTGLARGLEAASKALS